MKGMKQFGDLDGAGKVTLKRGRVVYPIEQTQGTEALQACGLDVSWVAGSYFTQQQEIYAPLPPSGRLDTFFVIG